MCLSVADFLSPAAHFSRKSTFQAPSLKVGAAQSPHQGGEERRHPSLALTPHYEKWCSRRLRHMALWREAGKPKRVCDGECTWWERVGPVEVSLEWSGLLTTEQNHTHNKLQIRHMPNSFQRTSGLISPPRWDLSHCSSRCVLTSEVRSSVKCQD